MSLALSAQETRRAPRESVDWPTYIEANERQPAPAIIINLSPSGCMVRCDDALPIGASLSVDMPGLGRQRGRVIWSRDARVGIEFDSGISLDACLPLLALMRFRYNDMPDA